ncbi:hypothetical protein AXX17_AT1G53120 [Arabidopsis thaliana]|uniref:Uncharacterized protein n=1 Tax=Arabidopsis thaliana TaxID=3702 RepID=A0A178WLF4_ARATH|nr:hypothetical protein AXX17_AT1G53120 [Arabidopsis thaliana]
MWCFVLGGLAPFVIGITVHNHMARDLSLFCLTTAIIGFLLTSPADSTSDNLLDPRSLHGHFHSTNCLLC